MAFKLAVNYCKIVKCFSKTANILAEELLVIKQQL